MITSILTSIKQLLGITKDDTSFDDVIIMHINRAFVALNDLGVGPIDGYRITSDMETWNDYLGDSKNLDDVQTYVYLKVKMVFDPPLSQSHINAIKEDIKELEWRLNVRVDKEG